MKRYISYHPAQQTISFSNPDNSSVEVRTENVVPDNIVCLYTFVQRRHIIGAKGMTSSAVDPDSPEVTRKLRQLAAALKW